MVRPGPLAMEIVFPFLQKSELAQKKKTCRPAHSAQRTGGKFLAGRAVGFFREISFPFSRNCFSIIF